MKNLTILTQSFHQKVFTVNCIKSLYQFKPADLKLTTIIIENSDDVSYKDEVTAISPNIVWINDPTRYSKSMGNAMCIMNGLKEVKDEWVVLLHNDTCITHENFFNSLIKKAEEGFELIGTVRDAHPQRHNSIIVLGCLVRTELAKKVDYRPKGQNEKGFDWDTGEKLDLYCREHNIPTFCFENSFNDKIEERLPEHYRDLKYTIRTIDEFGNVIFLHFARGTEKTQGSYGKPGRRTIPQVIEFCNKHIFNENRCERIEDEKFFKDGQQEQYKSAQIKNHAVKKNKHRNPNEYKRCYDEIERYISEQSEMICLGTRNNHERDCFKKFGSKLKKVYSLDIAPLSNADFIYDFNELPKDWNDRWDVVYTNCPDHTFDTTRTFFEWLRVTKPRGILLVGFSNVNIKENLNSYGCCTFNKEQLDDFFKSSKDFVLLKTFSAQYNYYLIQKI